MERFIHVEATPADSSVTLIKCLRVEANNCLALDLVMRSIPSDTLLINKVVV